MAKHSPTHCRLIAVFKVTSPEAQTQIKAGKQSGTYDYKVDVWMVGVQQKHAQQMQIKAATQVKTGAMPYPLWDVAPMKHTDIANRSGEEWMAGVLH
eukprot:1139507-Pelagomonas_calceolata.AAC.4